MKSVASNKRGFGTLKGFNKGIKNKSYTMMATCLAREKLHQRLLTLGFTETLYYVSLHAASPILSYFSFAATAWFALLIL